ncbi:UDP-glucose dehydrogenase family protein [Pontibacillus yanchengensis]|uniref:UDP-glucose 6-dehydrogenase n=1 Tax=Pontibacillus yanchengensis Y32 TaxID=1385514 RepID=A0A0A2TJ17_9BACI|nr:UDP-glucose/GDP-mannose dehydrogenase family protein [Pontibacillus yanchengensis]KGP74076.1 UDP-glucose 6-dehydrogenase [Pontibacillus yanchengensis Y32]
MKNIAVVGTGYVGLVTGVCLADLGHHVICIDVDEEKVSQMRKGHSPIYEPQLEDLMKKNIEEGRLTFTTNHAWGIRNMDVIFLAVGTPQQQDGSADLSYVQRAVNDIAQHINRDVVVVNKSTVPVGTNESIQQYFNQHVGELGQVDVVSNPEFLREGSAVYDMFHGDRIIIGADNEDAALLVEELYRRLKLPVVKTDIRSAEMIKYASNAFLATKISFINEISSICEKVGANIEDVAYGMGKDRRIGTQFLQAGIGYGGSCFPKDTNALVQIAGNVEHKFDLLESVIHVNNRQQLLLVKKAKERLGSLHGKRVAMLGLAFKPNTDDIREAASVVVANELIQEGAYVTAYDPIAMTNAAKVLNIEFANSVVEALQEADVALIITEWDEFKQLPLNTYSEHMRVPIVFDGRNCYTLEAVQEAYLEYHSIGRPVVGEVDLNKYLYIQNFLSEHG